MSDVVHAFLRALALDEAPIGTALLLVVAHPDDETLALGGSLARLPAAHVLVATDGAPRDMEDARRFGFATREAYAACRRSELDAALACSAVGPERLHRLDISDKEAMHAMARLEDAVAGLAASLAPALIVTHAYEGGHPDHDAVALAVHRVAAAHGLPIVEFPSYRDASGHGVITRQRYASEAGVTRPRLGPDARRRKAAMLACHASQAVTLQPFDPAQESLRPAPAHDFTAPPDPWPPIYETFGWDLRWAAWRAAVTAAVEPATRSSLANG